METTIKLDDSWTKKEDRSTSNLAIIANFIKRHVHFAKDGSRQLYFYENGAYHPGADELIALLYKQMLELWDKVEDWKAGRAAHLTEFIATDARMLWDKPPVHTINLLNGKYNWELGEFQESSHEWLSTIQIPVNYDPMAECPQWDRFLAEVLPVEGGANYLREIIGLCTIPFTGLQKCIILVGAGSNGKSTYLNGLQAFIGEKNISNLALHTLVNPQERFARVGLVGKLVNVFGDMSAKKIDDAANFKPLIGEDTITVEAKHRAAYSYRPFAKLIFSCNEVVKSDDDTEGYKRRFVHIPFTRKFAVDPKKGMELAEALASPEEQSGLLNQILPLIGEVVANGFTTTIGIASIIDEWIPVPDVVNNWLLENVEPVEGGVLPSTRFYDHLIQQCKYDGTTFERKNIIKYMRMLFPTMELNVSIKLKGIVTKCYRGVELKNKTLHTMLLEKQGAENEDQT